MKYPQPSRLEQIHVSLEEDGYEPVATCKAERAAYIENQERLQSSLLQLCPADLWPKNAYAACCPQPVLVTSWHQQQLAELHTALVLSITDIVNRWWTDPVARFPERMPLESKEEDLLQWMDAQVPHLLPLYKECLGSWRPDFLIELDNRQGDLPTLENFRISEINARFSFNGFMFLAYGQQALQNIGICDGSNGVIGAADPTKFLDGLLRLFRPGVPLHILKGEEAGMDIHIFKIIARLPDKEWL
ncbi:hypothetical protein EYZ11_012158 [Aspergillus tanneri]|uniref:Uncharacterized protein n=1 Tax=Aspergillus tanneri TaxID=1220188 RepID=A0A4S3J327_9EURO|nr:hypothetical protein EYZ11_012158 [Aspergillus tanneri]